MKRNQTGPYMTGDIGYDKDYRNWNLRQPLRCFPDLQNTNNTVILKMASYGEANRQMIKNQEAIMCWD